MAKRRVKEKIPKTKTFTGCWTCRSRSVKCDASRPTCQRCSKAGLVCEGYGVKLHWVTDEESVAPSAIKRQARSLEYCARWPYTLAEVDQFLEEVDNETADPNSTPFSVFNVHAFPQDVKNLDMIALEASPCLSINDLHTGYDSPQPNLTSPTRGTQPRPLEISPSAAHLNALAGLLLDNYVQNVTNLLQPIPHTTNSYSVMYVPSALVGSTNVHSVLSVHDASLTPTYSNIAIFYSVLAISAFHLRNKDANRQLDSLAREFRSRAFKYLRKGIEVLPLQSGTNTHSSNAVVSSRYEGAMAVMLTLVTADVMDGRMSEYWIHLDGVDQVRRQWQQEGKVLVMNRRQITIASFLEALSRTTTIDLPPLPWSPVESAFSSYSVDSQFPDCYGLEHTYGITSTLAGFMSKITILSQHISYFVSQDNPVPNSLVSECCDLLTLLSEWSLDDEELLSLRNADPDVQQIGGLHISAFAKALKVHFHTRLLPCSALELANLVHTVAESLNRIEHIKANLLLQAKAETCNKMTASLTWPGFIASCEAESHERHPWYEWWGSMLNYRIGNIAGLWQVVQESWGLRDSGIKEVPGWVPVLRRTGRRILAV